MISLVGNCQIHRLQYILKINGISDFEYFANTPTLDPDFNPEQVLEHIACSSIVIAQPIQNLDHPLNYQVLQATNKNTLFLPYVFLDGLFSLSTADAAAIKIYGDEPILQILRDVDLGRAVEHFMNGVVDFQNAQRVETSLLDLESRERECCAVIASDILRDNLYDRLPMLTHNHPAPFVFDKLAARLFRLAGWSYAPMHERSIGQRVDYVFGQSPRVLSPFDVAALNLQYQADVQWFNIGHQLIMRMNEPSYQKH